MHDYGHPSLYTPRPERPPRVLNVLSLSACCSLCLLPFVPTIDWICCLPLLNSLFLHFSYVVLVAVAFLDPTRPLRALSHTICSYK